MEIQKVLRQEKKYLLTVEQALRLEARLAGVLKEDPHNGTTGYLVRSLYFDTMNDKDYYEKMAGTEVRRKMRIRIYHPEDKWAYLEIKQKQGANQLKRSMRIEKKHAQTLAQGDYSPLKAYSAPFAWEYYGILAMNSYRPRTVVQYCRKAYVLPENSIRITFDSRVASTECSSNIFDPGLLIYPVMPSWKVIMEVKYDGFLLSYVKNLLDRADKSELAVSKYCLARAVSRRTAERI